MKPKKHMSISEFFDFTHPPFGDTYAIKTVFLTQRDRRITRQSINLIRQGKSFALTGPSGSGKSTLIRHVINSLDPNSYRVCYIHYGGLQRSGILKAIADELGINAGGRALPLLVKIQKYIFALGSQAKPLYPIFVIDDAQLMEPEALMDLCSLTVSPAKRTISASIALVGDEALAKKLALHAMTPIRTRMTVIFNQQSLDEKESEAFIAFRLKTVQADENLFDPDALSLVCANCRGNRRQIMNMGTLLLDEAFYREENTIGANLIYESDLFDIAE
ncbi:MAG: hypothetical protein DRP52_06780 [Planctomycetota bacterium]|nr:MAG: hypothetical protein DRP52_06780 [Planctomycetota bacterium]